MPFVDLRVLRPALQSISASDSDIPASSNTVDCDPSEMTAPPNATNQAMQQQPVSTSPDALQPDAARKDEAAPLKDVEVDFPAKVDKMQKLCVEALRLLCSGDHLQASMTFTAVIAAYNALPQSEKATQQDAIVVMLSGHAECQFLAGAYLAASLGFESALEHASIHDLFSKSKKCVGIARAKLKLVDTADSEHFCVKARESASHLLDDRHANSKLMHNLVETMRVATETAEAAKELRCTKNNLSKNCQFIFSSKCLAALQRYVEETLNDVNAALQTAWGDCCLHEWKMELMSRLGHWDGMIRHYRRVCSDCFKSRDGFVPKDRLGTNDSCREARVWLHGKLAPVYFHALRKDWLTHVAIRELPKYQSIFPGDPKWVHEERESLVASRASFERAQEQTNKRSAFAEYSEVSPFD